MQLADQIDRRAGLSRDQFEREYLRPLRPVILTDAISHWRALGRWSPQFFKTEYGDLEIEVDGEAMALGDLIDRVEASTDDNPAPYLRNQALAEVAAGALRRRDPDAGLHTPNWLESRIFPEGRELASVEVYIGGRGAQFPVLHYDGLHTHAFLMQLYGDKEYIVFGPEQTRFMYPQDGIRPTSPGSTTCSIPTSRRSRCSTRPRAAVSTSSGRDPVRALRLVAHRSDREPVGDRFDQRREPREQRGVPARLLRSPRTAIKVAQFRGPGGVALRTDNTPFRAQVPEPPLN